MLPIRDRLPSQRPPIVNWLLIAGNVGAFIWMQALLSVAGPRGQTARAYELLMEWGLVPARILHEPIAALPTILSSMFMHDPTSFAHIGGNMLYLWIFGDNVEDALGHFRYAFFYITCGIFAAMAQFFVDPNSVVPMVGASGAISGVLAAYGMRYPRSPITVINPFLPLWFIFGFFLELPAWVLILQYFLVNMISGLASLGAQGGGVAFFAHLGGFVGGALLARFMGKPPRDHERWTQIRSQRSPPYRGPRGGRGPRDPWSW